MMKIVMAMKVITTCSYYSDQQYQNKGGRRPRLHGSVAPFPTFQSQTRSLLFLHIGAPAHEYITHLADQIYTFDDLPHLLLSNHHIHRR